MISTNTLDVQLLDNKHAFKLKIMPLWMFSLFFIFPFTLMAKPLKTNPCTALYALKKEKNAKKVSQILLVKASLGFKSHVYLCQHSDQSWLLIAKIPVVLGKKGVAAVGQKKEGDLKTPAGFFSIGEAFGNKPLALKMDYKYLTKKDKWITDPNSALYNQWVLGNTSTKNYEVMDIAPYQLGAVIQYNTHPVKKGAGSAIFIHLWRSPNTPTAGCIAMQKNHLLQLLHWLDKKQQPSILIQK